MRLANLGRHTEDTAKESKEGHDETWRWFKLSVLSDATVELIRGTREPVLSPGTPGTGLAPREIRALATSIRMLHLDLTSSMYQQRAEQVVHLNVPTCLDPRMVLVSAPQIYDHISSDECFDFSGHFIISSLEYNSINPYAHLDL